MSRPDSYWAARFPDLFKKSYNVQADCGLGFTTEPVPAELVTRLHLVAATSSNQLIVCRSVEEWRFLPGGSREKGETLPELARRELLEEAGACITGEVQLFAAQVADSHRAEPYKPHHPHPRSYWAYGVAEARVIQPPTNPPDGEHVIEVLTMAPDQAADYVGCHDALHADVIRLAAAMDLIRTGGG
jgi:8-oxo-dGTP diphosphatase